MSLNWKWSRKSGTITEIIGGAEQTYSWYEGNALMIVLDEFTDEHGTERYSLHWFLCDEVHAKRCFGLVKGYEGMSLKPTKLTIYRENCWQWEKIVKLFAKAFPDIEITVKAKAPA